MENYGDQGVRNETGEKQSDFGDILKVYAIEFPGGSDMGYERKELDIKDDVKDDDKLWGLGDWSHGIAII